MNGQLALLILVQGDTKESMVDAIRQFLEKFASELIEKNLTTSESRFCRN